MIPMIIVVRVGLGLAYEGASNTPYRRGHSHTPSSSAPSSGRRNVGQLSTFRAASPHDDTDVLNGTSCVDSSSRSKLGGSGTVLDSGDDMDSPSAGGKYGEEERHTEMTTVRSRSSVGGQS